MIQFFELEEPDRKEAKRGEAKLEAPARGWDQEHEKALSERLHHRLRVNQQRDDVEPVW